MTRVLITAGPTYEPVDPVRFIGNRSSGRVGVALAEAAREAGWETTLALGPGTVDPPREISLQRFTSTHDLEELLRVEMPRHDVLIMAAAVADYRPRSVATSKLPREESLSLELVATPDLVKETALRRHPGQLIVAFALEQPEGLVERATAKLRRKQVDAIVANPLETMDSDAINATLIWSDGSVARAGSAPCSKAAFGRWLIAQLKQRLDLAGAIGDRA